MLKMMPGQIVKSLQDPLCVQLIMIAPHGYIWVNVNRTIWPVALYIFNAKKKKKIK